MKAKFANCPTRASRIHLASALGLLLILFTAGSASAELATPEQKRACTPDVYRLCPGEIPNVRAITAAERRAARNQSRQYHALLARCWCEDGRAGSDTSSAVIVRLDRTIQYAAAMRFYRGRLRLLDPRLRGDDEKR